MKFWLNRVMVVAKGNTTEAVQNHANATLAMISTHIRDLGLQLVVKKTGVVVFKSGYWAANIWL